MPDPFGPIHITVPGPVRPSELRRLGDDGLDRGLFTVDEAKALDEDDMRSRPGAQLHRTVLRLPTIES